MRKKYIFTTIIVLLINYLIDQLTKYFAVQNLKGDEPVYFLKDTIMIYYAENSGAFLGMGTAWPPALKYIVLLILPIMFCLYGIYFCLFKEKSLTRLVLFSTIIGGGLSNLIDRLFNDFAVVDFLNFGIGSLRTGILNIADLSVTFGVFILLFYELKYGKKQNNG